MLPLRWTIDRVPGFDPSFFRELVRELRRGEFAEVRLLVAGLEGLDPFAGILEERGIPFVVTLVSRPPREVGAGALARYLQLKRVEVEMGGPQDLESLDVRALVDWGLPLWVSLPLSEELTENLEGLVQEAVSAGVERFLFDRLAPGAGLPGEGPLKELGSRISTLYQEGWPVAIAGCFPYCHTPALFANCGAGVSSCVIRGDGGCYPCRHSPEPLGNLREAPLRYLWNSEAFASWAGQRAEECRECPLFTSCRSGCRAALGRGVPDPLIRGFKLRLRPSPILHPFRVDESLRVSLRARRCHYRQGDLLVAEERVAAVEPEWAELLQAAEGGAVTVGEVRSRHGEEGLRRLFSLYLDGFVRFSGSGGDRP